LGCSWVILAVDFVVISTLAKTLGSFLAFFLVWALFTKVTGRKPLIQIPVGGPLNPPVNK
jgi:hypothetical protein